MRIAVWGPVALGGVLVAGEVLAEAGAFVWVVVFGMFGRGSVAETGDAVGRCALGALADGQRLIVGSGAADAIGALEALAGACLGGRVCGRATTAGARAGVRAGAAAATGTYTGTAA